MPQTSDNTFNWISEELHSVNTRKFHVINDRMRDHLEPPLNSINYPHSYTIFVSRFGCAKFFRELSYYLIQVNASPWLAQPDDGFIRFGTYDTKDAAFRVIDLGQHIEAPVYEGPPMIKTADSFGEWLALRFRHARQRYTRSEWSKIVKGPRPFSKAETEMVEARRRIQWRLVGVSADGWLRIEVINQSSRSLPYLSIGLRSIDGNLNGGIWLPIADVAPGATRIVEHEGYRTQVPNQSVELFPLDDPEPEDRERYWEFRDK